MKISKKRFLTIFFSALLILLGFVGLFVYELFRIRPNNVHFTNVTSSSVTVSWNTEKAIPASVRVFEGDRVIPFSIYHNNDRFFDTRDVKEAELLAVQQTSDNIVENDDLAVSADDFQTDVVVTGMGEYYTHHVTITNLKPKTEYSFMVGDRYVYREVKDVDGDTVVSTLEVPQNVRSPLPAYGTVKNAENQEDTPIDELASVTDGVIYFNYWDEFSDERSAVYSSSFNREGNWYMDVSNAVGKDGKHFISRFEDSFTNIWVELVIDAGPWGNWKKRVIFDRTSPTEMIVINDPLMIDDEEAGVKRLDSLVDSRLVKGVEAATCSFVDYCGPCFEGVLSNPCTCPASTLKFRGCKGESSKSVQEAAQEIGGSTSSSGCSGNGSNGDFLNFGGVCKKCQKHSKQDFYLWSIKGVNEGDCDGISKGHTSGAPQQINIAEENNRIVMDNQEMESTQGNPDSDQWEGQTCITPYGTKKVGSTSYICKYVGQTLKWVKNDSTDGQSCSRIDSGLNRIFNGSCYECKPLSEGFSYEWKKVSSSECLEGGGEKDVGDSDSAESCGDGVCTSGETFYNCSSDCGSFSGSTGDPAEADEEEDQQSREIAVDDKLVKWCGPNNVGKPCENPLGIIGVCSTGNKCVIPGSECSDGTLGRWNEEGGCIPYTSDELCWVRRLPVYTLYKGSGENRMVCSDGVWVPDPVTKRTENWCKLGDSCNEYLGVCLTGENKYLVCDFESFWSIKKVWQEVKEDYKDGIAYKVDPTHAGEKCNAWKCRCVDGVDKNKIISEGEWCRESGLRWVNALDSYSRVCRKKEEGVVCSRNGLTCTLENRSEEFGKNYYCSGKKPESSSTNQSRIGLISLKDFTSQVLGQETENQFLIDQSTGMFTQMDQGTYEFEYQGENYAFDIGSVNTNGVLIYIDDNENGKYDEETDINVSEIASIVNITTVEKAYRYNLKAGLNFISLPFLISYEDYRTAAGLLTKLNEVYDDAFYSISKFDGRWKIVGQNVEIYDNNDFQLLPGEGYMIKARRDIDISIVGQPVQLETEGDKSPIYMTQGWNLIGLYGSGIKSYTAKTLIEDINKENFTADNVTKWASDKQMYEGFQLTDGEEYGFDYPLNILESYFVRITEGKGNLQPSLSGNN
jgi:hypothetical protein